MNVTAYWRALPAPLRKPIVMIVGATVVLIGLVMFITPGPGFLVMTAGLAILSIEFVWARRLLKRYTSTATKVAGALGLKVKASGPVTKPPPTDPGA